MSHTVDHQPVPDRKPNLLRSTFNVLATLGLGYVAITEIARNHLLHGVVAGFGSWLFLREFEHDLHPSSRAAHA